MEGNNPLSGLRFKFSKEEDAILSDIVSKNRYDTWANITKQFNWKCVELLHGFTIVRNERQCRDRWLNFLSPDINRSPWTEEEDALILEKYGELGPQWALISKSFKGRKDNAIKNRLKLLMRKNGLKDIPLTKKNVEPKKAPPMINVNEAPEPKDQYSNFMNFEFDLAFDFWNPVDFIY